MSRSPGIVHVTPEMAPYASTGGLAQVVGSLPPRLARSGCPVTVILPRYGAVDPARLRPLDVELEIPVGAARHAARVLCDPRRDDVRVLFLDVPTLYDRPRLYGERGRDYRDNAARFIALCRGALATIRALELPRDILHVHDWQTALIPVLVAAELDDDPFWRDTRTVLTIHNLAYQGRFWHLDMPLTGLPWALYTPRCLEYWNQINFLKGGIVTADAITTVSPRYAEEILQPEYGFGLEGVLRDRRDDLFGILNGIDRDAWDPATDPCLPARYSAERIQGKGRCKRAVLRELELDDELSRPLFGMVSRLVEQKGVDLVLKAIPAVMKRQDVALAVLGTGEPRLETALEAAASRWPGRVAARIDFDEGLSRRIFAGSDFALVPSRFEPCGLAQMYAMRYGSIPVATPVGGLADTVVDADEHPDSGNGLVIP
ncbi:MAG: glycogen synthase, partial [Acidobacteriota bacterium]